MLPRAQSLRVDNMTKTRKNVQENMIKFADSKASITNYKP